MKLKAGNLGWRLVKSFSATESTTKKIATPKATIAYRKTSHFNINLFRTQRKPFFAQKATNKCDKS